MKLSLLLLALAPFTASAAESYTCSVTTAVAPRQFTNELLSLTLTGVSETHYVLLNKDLSAAEEISAESYQARKDEKRFGDIDGQAMAIFQREEDNLVYVTVGYVSAAEGKLVNGGSALSWPVTRMVAYMPLDGKFIAGCDNK
jgi:hypothetical protein